jgi:WxcM-like, C-terminal
VPDPRGNLTFIESGRHVPFDVARVYWTYNVPGGSKRGGHAYRCLEECVVALSGSFDVLLDDGKHEGRVTLNRSYFGLYLPTLVWRSLENFSTNAVCVVLASRPYDEADYIRDHAQFQAEVART